MINLARPEERQKVPPPPPPHPPKFSLLHPGIAMVTGDRSYYSSLHCLIAQPHFPYYAIIHAYTIMWPEFGVEIKSTPFFNNGKYIIWMLLLFYKYFQLFHMYVYCMVTGADTEFRRRGAQRKPHLLVKLWLLHVDQSNCSIGGRQFP